MLIFPLKNKGVINSTGIMGNDTFLEITFEFQATWMRQKPMVCRCYCNGSHCVSELSVRYDWMYSFFLELLTLQLKKMYCGQGLHMDPSLLSCASPCCCVSFVFSNFHNKCRVRIRSNSDSLFRGSALSFIIPKHIWLLQRNWKVGSWPTRGITCSRPLELESLAKV